MKKRIASIILVIALLLTQMSTSVLSLSDDTQSDAVINEEAINNEDETLETLAGEVAATEAEAVDAAAEVPAVQETVILESTDAPADVESPATEPAAEVEAVDEPESIPVAAPSFSVNASVIADENMADVTLSLQPDAAFSAEQLAAWQFAGADIYFFFNGTGLSVADAGSVSTLYGEVSQGVNYVKLALSGGVALNAVPWGDVAHIVLEASADTALSYAMSENGVQSTVTLCDAAGVAQSFAMSNEAAFAGTVQLTAPAQAAPAKQMAPLAAPASTLTSVAFTTNGKWNNPEQIPDLKTAQGGGQSSLVYTLTALDQNGSTYTGNVTYTMSLGTNASGITITPVSTNANNNSFIVTITPAAGVCGQNKLQAELIVSADDGGKPVTDVDYIILDKAAAILTSCQMNIAPNPVVIPTGSNISKTVISLDTVDQFGQPMICSSYTVKNLPKNGVTVSQKDGDFTLSIDASATPGTSTVYGTASHDGISLGDSADLILSPAVNQVLTSVSVVPIGADFNNPENVPLSGQSEPSVTYQLIGLDQNNNALSKGITYALGGFSNYTGVSFAQDPNNPELTTVTVTSAAGSYGNSSYPVTMQAAASDGTNTVTQNVTFYLSKNTAKLTSSVLTLSRSSVAIPASGKTETVTATVAAYDQYGVALPGATYRLVGTLPTGVTKSGTTSPFTLTIDSTATAGKISLSGISTYNGTNQSGSANLTLTGGATLNAVKLTPNTAWNNPQPVPLAGSTESRTYTLTATDTNGNVMSSGVAYNLYATKNSNGVTIKQVSGTSNQYTVTIDPTAGVNGNTTLQVDLEGTATVGSVTVKGSDSFYLSKLTSKLTTVNLSLNPPSQTIPAAGKTTTSLLTVDCFDQYGAAITSNLTYILGTLPTGVTTNDKASPFTLTIDDSATAGNYTITCNVKDLYNNIRNTATLTLTGGTPRLTSVTLLPVNGSFGNPETVPDLKSACPDCDYQLIALDQFGNAYTGSLTYDLSTTEPGINIKQDPNNPDIFNVQITPAAGQLGNKNYPAVLTATVDENGTIVTGTETIYLDKAAAVITTADFTISPSTITIPTKGNTSTTTCTMNAYDQYGGVIPFSSGLYYCHFTSSTPTGVTIQNSSTNTNTGPMIVDASATAGTYTLTANVIGASITIPVSATFTLVSSTVTPVLDSVKVTPLSTGFTGTTAVPVVNASEPSDVYVVTAYDQNGNAFSGANLNLKASDAGVTVSAVSGKNGQYTVTVTSAAGTYGSTTSVTLQASATSGSTTKTASTSFNISKQSASINSVTLSLNPATVNIPLKGNTSTAAATIKAFDQYGAQLSSGVTYDLRGFPNGVTSTAGSNGIYALSVSSYANPGAITLTGEATYKLGTMQATADLTLVYPSVPYLDSVTVEPISPFSDPEPVPYAGLSSDADFRVDAYDQYGNPITQNIAFNLQTTETGIDVKNIAGHPEKFMVTIQPNAGDYGNPCYPAVLTGSATYGGKTLTDSYTQNLSKENANLTTADLTINPAAVNIPTSGKTATATATINGYDQYGAAMTSGLSYKLTGEPSGVTVSGGTNGVYTLTVASTAVPGGYSLTADASDANTTLNPTATLILQLNGTPYLDHVTVTPDTAWGNPENVPLANDPVPTRTYTVTAYDQYGNVLSSGVTYTLTATQNGTGININKVGGTGNQYTVEVTSAAGQYCNSALQVELTGEATYNSVTESEYDNFFISKQAADYTRAEMDIAVFDFTRGHILSGAMYNTLSIAPNFTVYDQYDMIMAIPSGYHCRAAKENNWNTPTGISIYNDTNNITYVYALNSLSAGNYAISGTSTVWSNALNHGCLPIPTTGTVTVIQWGDLKLLNGSTDVTGGTNTVYIPKIFGTNTLNIEAKVYDSNNQEITGQTFNWTGTMPSNVTLTGSNPVTINVPTNAAPDTTGFALRASVGGSSNTTTVKVLEKALITSAATLSATFTGTPYSFPCDGTDGYTSSLAYTKSGSAISDIIAEGLFYSADNGVTYTMTAPVAAGTYLVKVILETATEYAESVESLTLYPVIDRVEITRTATLDGAVPYANTTGPNSTYTLTAYDQFGNVLTSGVTYTLTATQNGTGININKRSGTSNKYTVEVTSAAGQYGNSALQVELTGEAEYNSVTKSDTDTFNLSKDTAALTKTSITLTPKTVQIPASGAPSNTSTATLQAYDQYGLLITSGVTYVVSGMPSGVTWDGSTKKLSVSSSASPASVTITSDATYGGITKSATNILTLTYSSTPVLTSVLVEPDSPWGSEYVPAVNATYPSRVYTLTAKDQYGNDITSGVTYSMGVPNGTGITFTQVSGQPNQFIMTITPSAGSYGNRLRLCAEGTATMGTKTVYGTDNWFYLHKQAARLGSVTVKVSPNSVDILPAAQTQNQYTVTADVFDQYGAPFTADRFYCIYATGKEIDSGLTDGTFTYELFSNALPGQKTITVRAEKDRGSSTDTATGTATLTLTRPQDPYLHHLDFDCGYDFTNPQPVPYANATEPSTYYDLIARDQYNNEYRTRVTYSLTATQNGSGVDIVQGRKSDWWFDVNITSAAGQYGNSSLPVTLLMTATDGRITVTANDTFYLSKEDQRLDNADLTLNPDTVYIAPIVKPAKTTTATLEGLDQYGAVMKGLRYTLNGVPSTVTQTQNGNVFTLTVGSTSIPDKYTLTGEAEDSNKNIATDKETLILQYAGKPQLFSLTIVPDTPWSNPEPVPKANESQITRTYTLTAYDDYGNVVPKCNFKLSGVANDNGIKIQQDKNNPDQFEVTVTQSAGSYGQTVKVTLEGFADDGNSQIIDYATFDLSKEAQALDSAVLSLSPDTATIPVAGSPAGSSTVNAAVKGYDQYGAQMTSGLTYDVTGLPTGVFKSGANPKFILDVASTAAPNTYTIIGEASDGINTARGNASLTLKRNGDPVLTRVTAVPSSAWNDPTAVPEVGVSEQERTYTLTAYDQYDNVMTGAAFNLTGKTNATGINTAVVSGHADQYTATVTSAAGSYNSTIAATLQASATIGTVTVTADVTFNLSKNAAALTSTTLTISPAAVTIPLARSATPATTTATVKGYDQYGALMTSGLTYDVTGLPDDVSKSGSGNSFTLTVASTAQPGTTMLTGSAEQGINKKTDNASLTLSYDTDADPVLTRVTAVPDSAWSDPTAVPEVGESEPERTYTLTAYDQYDNVMTGAAFNLTGKTNATGINTAVVGGHADQYTATVTSAAGSYNSTIAATLQASAAIGTVTATADVTFNLSKDAAVFTSASLSLNPAVVPIPETGSTASSAATLKGLDQYGAAITSGLSYTLTGNPAGVNLSGGTNGVFTLTVLPSASTGSTTLTGKVTQGSTEKTATASLTLNYGEDPTYSDIKIVRNGAEITADSMYIPYILASERRTYKLYQCDQYGNLMDEITDGSWSIDPAYTGVSVSNGTVTVLQGTNVGTATVKAESDGHTATLALTLQAKTPDPAGTDPDSQIDITFAMSDLVYGDTVPQNATVQTGAPTGSFTYLYEGVSTTVYAQSTTAPKNVGSYKATAIYETADRYDSAEATFAITPKPISANVAGDAAVPVDYTAWTHTLTTGTGVLTGDTVNFSLAYTPTLPSPQQVGSYAISVASDNPNYKAQPITGLSSFSIYALSDQVATTITLNGSEADFAIPTLSASPASRAFTVEVKDQNGYPINNPTVSWSVTTTSGGVSISSGTVTVDSTATAGATVKVIARSGSVSADKSFRLKYAAAPVYSDIRIVSGGAVITSDTMCVPYAAASESKTYQLYQCDQYGNLMDEITDGSWSIDPAYTGVSVSSGTVIVLKNTALGTATVKAAKDGHNATLALTLQNKTPDPDYPDPDSRITVSFSMADVTYGDTITPCATVNATAPAGVFTYFYEGVAPTVYAQSTVAPKNVGSYKAIAVYETADRYDSAEDTFAINPKSITVNVTGDAAVPVDYTAWSHEAESTELLSGDTVNFTISYNPAVPTPQAVGSYAVEVSTTNSNYTVGSVTGITSFSIYALSDQVATTITLNGSEADFAIPTLSASPANRAFTVEVKDQNGYPINNATVNWSVTTTSADVSISGGTVYVGSLATAGTTVKVIAQSGAVSADKSFKLKYAAAPVYSDIRIVSGGAVITSDTMCVPYAAASESKTYQLYQCDQYGNLMDEITDGGWSIDPAYTGVSVSSGTVSVLKNTALGTVTVKAAKDGHTASLALTLQNKTPDPAYPDPNSQISISFTMSDVVYGNTISPNASVQTGAPAGSFTYLYEGVTPTVYALSTTAPKNVGSYKAIAVYESADRYDSAEASFAITPKPISANVTGNAMVPVDYTAWSHSVTPGSGVLSGDTVNFSIAYSPAIANPQTVGAYTIVVNSDNANYKAEPITGLTEFQIYALSDQVATSITLTGSEDDFAIPTESVGSASRSYSAVVKDQNGYPINGATILWDVETTSSAVTISSGTVTVGSAATADVTVKVIAKVSESVKADKTFTLRHGGDSVYSGIKIVRNGAALLTDTMCVPYAAASESKTYQLYQCDQYGTLMDEITDGSWSIDPAYTGVSVTGGTVTVLKGTVLGEVTVKAAKDSHTATLTLTLQNKTPDKPEPNDQITISFSMADVTYGDPVTPNATVQTGAPAGVFTYFYEGVAPTTYVKSTTAPKNAGSYKVSAVYETESLYEIAEDSFAINPKSISVKVTGDAAVPEDYTGWSHSAESTEILSGDTVNFTISYNPAIPTPQAVGSYDISVSADNANYTVGSVTGLTSFSIYALGDQVATTITLNGSEADFAIPSAATGTDTRTFTVTVKDQNGYPINNPTTVWSVDTTSAGVTIANGVVSVAYTAAAGASVKVTAQCGTVSADKSFTLTYAGSLVFTDIAIVYAGAAITEDTMCVPYAAASESKTYQLYRVNQYGGLMTEITDGSWSIDPSYTGVGVSDGTVTVLKNTKIGTATVKAAYAGHNTALTLTLKNKIPDPAYPDPDSQIDVSFSMSDVVYGNTISPNASVQTGAPAGAFTYLYEGVAPTVYTQSTTAPKNVGSYKAIAVYETADRYDSAEASFAITPRDITVAVTGTAGPWNVGDADYSHRGVPSWTKSGDTLVVTLAYTKTGGSAETHPTTAGTYTISATVDSDNYNVTGVTGITSFVISAGAELAGFELTGDALTIRVPYVGQPDAVVMLPYRAIDQFGNEYELGSTPVSFTVVQNPDTNGLITVGSTDGRITVKACAAAGELQIKLSAMGASETKETTIPVTILRDSVLRLYGLTISGATTISVPEKAAAPNTVIETYTATGYDQYGAAYSPIGTVTYGLREGWVEGMSMNSTTGELTVGYNAAARTITIVAQENGAGRVGALTVTTTKNAPTLTTLQPQQSDIVLHIPGEGEPDNHYAHIEVIGIDQYGKLCVVDPSTLSWSIAEAPVTGVSIDSTTGEIVVNKTAQPGYITVCATDGAGHSVNINVLLSRGPSYLKHLVLSGDTTIAVPEKNKTNSTSAYTVTGIDQYHQPYAVTGNVTFSLLDTPEGVSIDPATGIVTLSCKAEAGILTVIAKEDETFRVGTLDLTVTKADSYVAGISAASDEPIIIVIPNHGEDPNTHEPVVIVGEDQYGDPIVVDPATLTWSLENEPITGVHVDSVTGEITVTEEAESDTVTVIVRDENGNSTSITVRIVSGSEAPVLTGLKLSVSPATVAKPETTDSSVTNSTDSITATGVDQYGATIACGTVTYSLKGAAIPGVSIDPATGVVSVNNRAAAGTVTVIGTDSNGKTGELEITITAAPPVLCRMYNEDAGASINIPAEGKQPNQHKPFEVKGEDQYGDEYIVDPADLTWSVKGGSVTGVSIDSETGVVTVTDKAEAGFITIIANDGKGHMVEIEIELIAPAVTGSGLLLKLNSDEQTLLTECIDDNKITVAADESAYAMLCPLAQQPVNTKTPTIVLVDDQGTETTLAASALTYTVNGTLPDGISFNSTIGTFSANPDAFGGKVTVTVTYGSLTPYTFSVFFIDQNYILNVDVTGIDGDTGVLYVDGVGYPATLNGNIATVHLPDHLRSVCTIYRISTNGSFEAERGHNLYPSAMYVWTVAYADGQYTATREEALDDLLRYEGTQIRIKGVHGIRLITSIANESCDALLSKSGLGGWRMMSNGTVVGNPSKMSAAEGLAIGATGIVSAEAYPSNLQGNVWWLFEENGRKNFTNVLVNFTDDQLDTDYDFCPYIVLKNVQTGREITLYGGTARRSIGYVAYQLRDHYEKGAIYDYVWRIINITYPDVEPGE